MTQSLGVSSGLAASASTLIRTLVALVVLTVLFYVIRWAIVTFTGIRWLQLGRKKYRFFTINLLGILLLFLSRAAMEAVLGDIGKSLERILPFAEPGYPGMFLTGIYYTLLSTLILILLIQGIGAVYWLIEGILDRWAQRQAAFPPTSLRKHMRKGFSLLNHTFRVVALIFVVMGFIPLVLRYFPRTSMVVEAVQAYMGNPASDLAQAIVNYLPNLAYLAIILGMGWLIRKLIKYFFNSLADGSLTIGGFLPEWAEPTSKLCRALLYIFLLMVSYPYLPGANSEFFKGFSVFLGAMLTFGSSGAIGNIVAGFVLTYTRAFRVGDMVKIGDTVGTVLEKTTLSTRLRTVRNEEVTIPNGIVLTSTVVDFSSRAASEGIVLTVTAGIGYDVDWRTVEALMIDAAKRTENILADPAPYVLKSDLGNYAVNYDLMAWTKLIDRPDRLLKTSSDLRRNVLDAFNAAGVEIMTPSVLSHRDASGLAIPTEMFPERPVPRGIAIDLRKAEEKGRGSHD